MTENILIFVAHSDDEAIGAGGTIAKYAREGKNVYLIVFSFGEGSNPILVKKEIAITRVREARRVGKVLGVKQTVFLGAKDGKIIDNIKNKMFLDKVRRFIREHKPSKIFTHSYADPHHDHRAVNKIIMKVLSEKEFEDYPVFVFDVWNPLNLFFNRNVPKMLVDITDTFETKLKALSLFRSQKPSVYMLMPAVLAKARSQGIANECRYAERFYRIR